MAKFSMKNSKSDFAKALILITIIVSILGYIDYITGEISIDILYMACVFLVTWYTNGIMGVLCILEILLAKVTADYYDHVDIWSSIYNSNVLYTLAANIIVCALIVNLKKALSK